MSKETCKLELRFTTFSDILVTNSIELSKDQVTSTERFDLLQVAGEKLLRNLLETYRDMGY